MKRFYLSHQYYSILLEDCSILLKDRRKKKCQSNYSQPALEIWFTLLNSYYKTHLNILRNFHQILLKIKSKYFVLFYNYKFLEIIFPSLTSIKMMIDEYGFHQ